jgi:hypothetical protein
LRQKIKAKSRAELSLKTELGFTLGEPSCQLLRCKVAHYIGNKVESPKPEVQLAD